MKSPRKIPIGISQCLLGEPVRYNGGHKLSRVCTEVLAEYFDYVPFCPEVAIGLGVPRPPIRLVESPLVEGEKDLRVLGVDDPALDVTRPLREYAETLAGQLVQLGGLILMQKSPSCGLRSTPVYAPGEPEPIAYGAGLFARRVRELCPDLPLAEARDLESREGREAFLAQVAAYYK